MIVDELLLGAGHGDGARLAPGARRRQTGEVGSVPADDFLIVRKGLGLGLILGWVNPLSAKALLSEANGFNGAKGLP